jgi:hypothetical protein
MDVQIVLSNIPPNNTYMNDICIIIIHTDMKSPQDRIVRPLYYTRLIIQYYSTQYSSDTMY